MTPELKSKKEAAVPSLFHELLWPEADSFRDLVYDVREIEDLSNYRSTAAHAFDVEDPYSRAKRKKRGRAELSSFCSVSGGGERRHFDLKPHGRLVELVKENMMLLPDYTINLEVHIYEDGLALVSAHYNQIIGSRWIALVDAGTVRAEGVFPVPRTGRPALYLVK